jgi:glycosyltransferase involved in cell wall biosynthesis
MTVVRIDTERLRVSERADLLVARQGATGPSVSVVIPALNEVKNLPYLLERMPPGHEIILIDGNSTDGTAQLMRELWPGATIFKQVGRGKGDALRLGFAVSTRDIIVTIDADGSTDPAEIPRFVAAFGSDVDFVKGSRFLPSGGSSDITRIRHIGNSILSGIVNILFGTRYTDLCYGYNAFRRSVLPQLCIDCNGFEVETLMNIRAAKARLRIAEVPSYESPRIHGVSNLHAARDGWRVFRTILREWLRQGGVPRAPDETMMSAVGTPRPCHVKT